ncbi:MAG: SidJ-related pseudokinase [Desulfobulbaceae bacterium]|nr:SidJ-related pseudokinase [Desulfobulbaceae bacterium]
MKDSLQRERQQLEGILRSPRTDFIASFMAVRSLHELLRKRAGLATPQTITTLADLFVNSRLTAERQGLFLFREAAGALLAIFVEKDGPRGEDAIQVLCDLLRHGSGAPQRAVCETLADLPVAMSVPELPPVLIAERNAPLLSWHDLPYSASVGGDAVFVGRSLVAPLPEETGVLVVKFARSDDCLNTLSGEAQWLSWLRSDGQAFAGLTEFPRPLLLQGQFLFRLRDLPISPPPHLSLHQQRYAISFIAPVDYYAYLNEPEDLSADGDLVPLLGRCAKVLGKLAGRGILHDALIPLFHNRVQRDRREDGGYYDWVLGGRLDRWLESCRHPNLGVSGLRDFEHLVLIDSSHRDLYRQLGAHFLSMLLVAASYFRNREPSLRGHLRDGTPVDARHLFDAAIFRQVVEEMYSGYYTGFTGLAAAPQLPFAPERLISRMIDEMGVDHHMEEILRRVDQEQMSDREFVEFLTQRGFSPLRCAQFRRGEEDIELATGPHLGGFNQSISLPELVEAVGGMAAMCVLGRYLAENDSSEERCALEERLLAGNG